MSLKMIMIDNMLIAIRKGKGSCTRISKSIQKAIKDSNWVQTMREEMKALERTSTWDIVMMIEQLTLKKNLAIHFEMKEVGKVGYFLGIDVAYSRKDIFIFQRKYVLDLLKIGKLRCQPHDCPLNKTHKIRSEESPSVKKSQSLMGKLIYLSNIRPDIIYVVSVVNQFMHNPHERHFKAVEKIFHYLKTISENQSDLAHMSPFDECNVGSDPVLQMPEYQKVIQLFTRLVKVESNCLSYEWHIDLFLQLRFSSVRKIINPKPELTIIRLDKLKPNRTNDPIKIREMQSIQPMPTYTPK
ncbi:putative mitochondrial protein, partial [Mucuna pruriens]